MRQNPAMMLAVATNAASASGKSPAAPRISPPWRWNPTDANWQQRQRAIAKQEQDYKISAIIQPGRLETANPQFS